MSEKQPLYVMMFSSGRTSAALAKYVKSNPKYQDVIFVILNTGKEREESLVFADKCDKAFGLNLIWLEAVINDGKGNGTTYKVVNFETASRKGEPFEQMLKKYPMPNNVGLMNCTRELKQRPIDSYLRDNFSDRIIKRIIGIRADEAHRKSIHAEAEGIIYPFCDEVPVDSRNIRKFWSEMPFDLELKDYEGNCDLCFKKSLKKRLTIAAENPRLVDWWKEMEANYGTEEFPRFDLRTQVSIPDLIELAKKPFTKAIDLHELSQQQTELFEIETDCFCKAT